MGAGGGPVVTHASIEKGWCKLRVHACVRLGF